MIKFFAQMRNPRRGHDAQGRLKKVRIDASAEGYSNYMAPMRISRIAEDVKKQGSEAKNVYSSEILKPETDTYLTAEWNEMVPFPNSKFIQFSFFLTSFILLLRTRLLNVLSSLENPLRWLWSLQLFRHNQRCLPTLWKTSPARYP